MYYLISCLAGDKKVSNMVKSNKKRKLLVPDCGSNELTGDPDDRSHPFSIVFS